MPNEHVLFTFWWKENWDRLLMRLADRGDVLGLHQCAGAFLLALPEAETMARRRRSSCARLKKQRESFADDQTSGNWIDENDRKRKKLHHHFLIILQTRFEDLLEQKIQRQDRSSWDFRFRTTFELTRWAFRSMDLIKIATAKIHRGDFSRRYAFSIGTTTTTATRKMFPLMIMSSDDNRVGKKRGILISADVYDRKIGGSSTKVNQEK